MSDLKLQLTRYRQAATPEIIAVVQVVADNGYPADTSGNRSSGGGRPASQPERGATQTDPDAQRAQALLARIDRINRGQFTEHELPNLLRYTADDLETYNPTRNETIQCIHCRQRRDRNVDECGNCGIPSDAWRCANPHHRAYIVGPARNGMCQACYRYHRRTGNHRPSDIIEREALARRTSDTQTMDCTNHNCRQPTPWQDLRDGRCKPCAGHWNSLGRERIPTDALNLAANVIVDGAA